MSSYFFVIIYNLFFYIFSFLLLINSFSLSNFLFLINRFSSFLLEVNKAWGIFTPSPSQYICLVYNLLITELPLTGLSAFPLPNILHQGYNTLALFRKQDIQGFTPIFNLPYLGTHTRLTTVTFATSNRIYCRIYSYFTFKDFGVINNVRKAKHNYSQFISLLCTSRRYVQLIQFSKKLRITYVPCVSTILTLYHLIGDVSIPLQ